MTRPSINYKEVKYYPRADFVIQTDDCVKTKKAKREKLDKYLGLVRDGKKLRNSKVTVIPIVTVALGKVPVNMEKRLGEPDIGGRIETMQSTVSLKSGRILRRVRKSEKNCFLTSVKILSFRAGGKNLQLVK